MTEYTESGTYKYSQTVNAQVNPNLSKTYNSWSDMANAVGETEVFAQSKITRKVKTKATKTKKATYSYTVPYVVTAHDFRLNIPSNAYVKQVRVEACMKLDSAKATVKFPNAHFMIYGGTGEVKQASSNQTGWHGSTYKVFAKVNLSTSEIVGTYTLSGEEWNKMAYPTSRLNHTIMGVDLVFNEPTSMSADSVGILIKWVRIKVDYEMPLYALTYDIETSKENPYKVSAGNQYCVNVNFANTTNADGGQQEIILKLPFSSTVISQMITQKNTDVDSTLVQLANGNYRWLCGGGGKASYTLKLCMETASFGLQTLNSNHENKDYPFYIDSEAFKNDNFERILIEHGTIQDGEPSCFKFSSKINTNASQIVYTVKVDDYDFTDWSSVSSELLEYYHNPDNGNNLIGWELEQSTQNLGVTLHSYTNNTIRFNIPANQRGKDIIIRWTGCFVPLFDGDNRIRVSYNNQNYYNEYYSLSAIGKSIYCTCEDSYWLDHRVLATVDTDAFVIPIASKSTDRLMIEGDCTLKAHIWEDIAYIGCVPIQHSHYEPDHDGTNEGLSESYKNKTYKGKKGIFEEDTSLKIKLRPQDWTTLEGLVRLDKPIPVNTVPTAFEGDVLNHRGWAEITGIKGVTKTNPLYYDGEIELDYLTHDINTRFTIEKGNFVNNYRNTLNTFLSPILNSGDEFSVYTYLNDEDELVSNPSGFFIVDTDGAYVYDGEAEETLRTMVALDNKQFVSIKSEKYLKEQSEISLIWNSTKIAENRENNIERIIRLVDSSNNPVFEYQYYDYEFDTNTNYYKCMVKAQRLLADNSWEEVLNKELLLTVDLESLQLIVDNDGNVIQESTPNYDEVVESGDNEDGEVYDFNDFIYGSTLKFTLNGNLLSIVDKGYNGRQISQDNIELVVDNYKYDLKWVNKNTDGETTDVISFFDFEVAENDLTSDFTNYYVNMVVSSFPVVDKTVLFTREGEEGVLYYLKNDGTPFSYIQEPFYMYNGGVDLKANNDISLFNLDNSYTVFYMQNGLVRIGFNRLNGDIYLSKWDNYSKQYITTTYMKGVNTDFKIGAFSDDKIEVKAGTTVYTMYRGHPYIVVNHPDEDLRFTTIWNSVYAEKVNDEGSDFPVTFDLVNNSNLLPDCIGGENLSNTCLDISQNYIEETVTNTAITLTKNTSTIYNGEYSYWTLAGNASSHYESIPIVSSYRGNFGEYSCETIVNPTIPKSLSLFFSKNYVQLANIYDMPSKLVNHNGEGMANQIIDFYEVGSVFKLINSTTITGTSTSDTIYHIIDDIGIDLSDKDFTIEWDMAVGANGAMLSLGSKTGLVNSNYRVALGLWTNGKATYFSRDTESSATQSSTNFNINTVRHCKIVKSGTTFTYYLDGTSLGTKTINWWSNYHDWGIYLLQWNRYNTTISNMKITIVED